MLRRFLTLSIIYGVLWLMALSVAAQVPAADFGAAAGDAVKLFELGQDFHERGQLAQALNCYREALKVRPDFPEAEYQSAAALLSLGRAAEAEEPLRRAAKLVPHWTLPQAALGALLVQLKRPAEAEEVINAVLALDEKNPIALSALAELKLAAPNPQETLPSVLVLLTKATAADGVPVKLWQARASVEHGLGRAADALATLTQAISSNPRAPALRQQRAELLAALKRYDEALADARSVYELTNHEWAASLFLAQTYAQAGQRDEALRVLDAVHETDRRRAETAQLYNSLLLSGPIDATQCAALEKLAPQQNDNAPFLARLGACTRTTDAARSLAYYRRASELDPRNADYAVGFAAALVQARRFADAVRVLRAVLAIVPDNLTARANLALALFEGQDYAAARTEFEQLAAQQPDNAVTYYFLGVANDKLLLLPEALAAYEKFLARADTRTQQLEIERVNLRLPSLRQQIKNGVGKQGKRP